MLGLEARFVVGCNDVTEGDFDVVYVSVLLEVVFNVASFLDLVAVDSDVVSLTDLLVEIDLTFLELVEVVSMVMFSLRNTRAFNLSSFRFFILSLVIAAAEASGVFRFFEFSFSS